MWSGTCAQCLGRGCGLCVRGVATHFRCPASMADDFGAGVVRAASAVEIGVMPVAGGYLDQPGKLMQLILIASSERARIEADAQQAEVERMRSESRRSRG